MSDQLTETAAAGQSDAATVDDVCTQKGSRITIDATGLVCPVPIIRLARAALCLTAGTEIELLTDDNAAIYDVPAWCRLTGASYLGNAADPGGSVTHLIRLGPVPKPPATAV